MGGAPAYWPWIQVLRQLLRGRDVEETRALLGTRAGALEQLLPELRPRLADLPRAPRLEPEQARFQLFDAVVGVLCDAAEEAPLLVVIEDLHASDPSSAMLLEMLAGPVRGASLMVVGTLRESEAREGPLAPVLSRVRRQARPILLERLGREEVREYLEKVAGTPDEAAVDALVGTSEGHPLFLAELVRLLPQLVGETGEEGVDPAAVALPRSLLEAIRERLEGRSAEARQLLETAAVMGREFTEEAVCTATPETCENPAPALAECADGATLVQAGPGRYRFAHILIREALYRDLDEQRRRSLHLRVAEALERVHGDHPDTPWAEVAHHYLAAGPRGRERGIAASTRAADRSMAQHAFDEAAEAYGRALDAVSDDPTASPVRRCELLLGLGAASLRGGHVREGRRVCREAAEVARRLGDPELLARAALEHGSVFVYAEVDPELVALLEEARSALGEGDSGLRARVLARLAAALQPAPDPAGPIAMAREAIGMARRAGDDAALLATMRDAVSAMMDLADPMERSALNREHIELARRLDVPVEIFRGHMRLVFDSIELGDVATVRAAIETCDRLARELAHPHYLWRVAALRAMVAIREGKLEEADRLREEAARLARRARDPNADRALLLQHAHRLYQEGELDALHALLPEVQASLDWTSTSGQRMARAETSGYLARTGRVEEARRHLTDEVVDDILDGADAAMGAMIAEVAVASEDRSLAGRAYEALAPRDGRFLSGGVLEMYWGPPVAFHLGRLSAVLKERERAREELERALAQARETDAPSQVARIARELETLLGHDGDAGAGRGSTTRAGPAPPSPLTLEHEGDYWTVRADGEAFRVRDVKGLHMLARLVAEPGREMHVLDLSGAAAGTDAGGTPRPGRGSADAGDAGEILDERARAAYRRRVAELRAEVEEAESWNDAGRAGRAREELAFLEQELARAVGLGGRERRAGAAAERARVNVQRRIRDAIRRVAEHDSKVGRHLSRSVRTGTFCCYEPE